MTRKEFFRQTGFDQPKDKKPFIDMVKKYKGRLSYLRMYLLIYTAIMLGKRGSEILSYVDAIMWSEAKK